MLKRILTGAAIFAVLVPVLWFSDTLVFPIFLSAVSMIAVGEMLHCIGFLKSLSITLPAILIAGAAPFGAYLIDSRRTFVLLALTCAYLYFFYLFCHSVTRSGKYAATDVCSACAMIYYVITGFCSLQLLRRAAHGLYLVLLVFIAAWMTDIFAYFSGRLFGRHKLCPVISPKKTVEGAIGGVLFCSLAFLGYGYLLQGIGILETHPVRLLLAGAALSVVSQFGDLLASMIKRHYGVKDFGRLLPGHGGIVDRFDSVIAVAPLLVIITGWPGLFDLFT